MIRSNDSDTYDRDDDRSPFGLLDISQEEINAELKQMHHITPSRLFRLSFGMIEETDEDRRHLEWCDRCRTAYKEYRCSVDPAAADDSSNLESCDKLRQQTLPGCESPTAGPNGKRFAPSFSSAIGQSIDYVPDALRKHCHIDGPVLFPGEEVAFESWQFGRLTEIRRDDPALERELVKVMTTAAETRLLDDVDEKNLMFVCFGRGMHRCGTRLAARFVELGLRAPHVVLAHDFYSPTLVCNPKEFRDADVIVWVDVVHTGGMLDRLMASCLEHSPRRVRGLALVDQSQRRPLCAAWDALWTEPLETRLSLEQFVREASQEEKRLLRRFEPNIGCARSNCTEVKTAAPNHGGIEADPTLIEHIHETGALKRDHVIGGKRYPYAVNVLDLLGKSERAKEFVLDRAMTALSDLAGEKACLVYHAGRARRAGTIAKVLGTRIGWQSFSIGTRGPTFALTDAQFRKLASYDTVVVVDAAVRTGDSISAMASALSDRWLRKHTRFVAFCVLNSLSRMSLSELSQSAGMDIRTLFELPLAPPSEDVGHWTNAQKAAIRERVQGSGTFAKIERAIGDYFEPPRPRPSSDPSASRSLDETKAMIDAAIASAQDPDVAVKKIAAACQGSKPSFIRHLTVNEVVHDERVQDMLLGVMYNSMSPSFKESAAFGLAAADNYDWMELQWLQCNRPFLAARGNAWKAIPLIECEMKLSNHTSELDRFRQAAIEFRERCVREETNQDDRQELFWDAEETDSSMPQSRSCKTATGSRVVERLEVMIEAAG